MGTKQTNPKEVKKVPVKTEDKKAKKPESKSQARRKAADVVRPNVTSAVPAGATQADITPPVDIVTGKQIGRAHV